MLKSIPYSSKNFMYKWNDFCSKLLSKLAFNDSAPCGLVLCNPLTWDLFLINRTDKGKKMSLLRLDLTHCELVLLHFSLSSPLSCLIWWTRCSVVRWFTKWIKEQGIWGPPDKCSKGAEASIQQLQELNSASSNTVSKEAAIIDYRCETKGQRIWQSYNFSNKYR